MKNAARISSSADRAERLIRDLLDFTQARLGPGIPIARGPVDLHELVARVAEEVNHAFPDRQLIVQSEGDGRGEWDADRLAQVLHNLFTNALKYSPAGTPMRVTSRRKGDTLELEVNNAGAPIAPELLPELFKPLRRGTQGTAKNDGSIGLGLFIVEQIVLAHGGSVSVRSTA